jgi:hypothetical protein
MAPQGEDMNFKVMLVASLVLAAPAAATEQLIGGSFEQPVIATVPGNIGSYVYPGAGTLNGWNYSGSGLINGTTATPWFGGTPPQGFGGSQYAFVQGLGSLSQGFVASASGLLTLSWLEGARPAISSFNGAQTYDVMLGATTLGQFSSISGQNFAARSLVLGAVVAGQSYSVRFKGLAATDSTVFLDNVSAIISPSAQAVPEPSTWIALFAGLGIIGMVARGRRQRPQVVTA